MARKSDVEALNNESPALRRLGANGANGFGDILNAIVDLINEVKKTLDALRTDFLQHDHGVTYTASVNGGASGLRRHATALTTGNPPADTGSAATTKPSVPALV